MHHLPIPSFPSIIFYPGSRNGLSLVLNVENYEYMAGPNNEAGAKLYLHNPQEEAMVRDLGFALAPGMHFLVDIDTVEVSWTRCLIQVLFFLFFIYVLYM